MPRAAKNNPSRKRADTTVKNVLPPDYFARPALDAARELLGKNLCRRLDGRIIRLPLTELEAYVGPEDRACHARRGKTQRTAVMFGPPGHWYVYFCYGVHWMLNIVTGPKGFPAAVLIRGAGDISGPGRLTKALSISKEQNTLPASPAAGLWIEDNGARVPESRVERAPRVGVAYAGSGWAARPYRFIWKRGNSKKRRTT